MQLAKVRQDDIETMGSMFDLAQAIVCSGDIMELRISPEELKEHFCDEKREKAFDYFNRLFGIYNSETGKICPRGLLRAMESLRHNFFHLVLAEDSLQTNACDPDLDHYELKPHLKLADDKHKAAE